MSTQTSPESIWKSLMLLPNDYGYEALYNEVTRKLMTKIEFEHGGTEYDSQYPKGIPTKMTITTKNGHEYDSGLILFPGGHSANKTVDLKEILKFKFESLGALGMDESECKNFVENLENIAKLDNKQLKSIYDCDIEFKDKSIDAAQ